MKELTRDKLPLWDESMGLFYTLSAEERQKNFPHDYSVVIFCQKKRRIEGKTSIGYVFNEEALARRSLKNKAKWLDKKGWQGHRVGSVPWVSCHKNAVKARKIHGLLKEFKDNLSCKESYKSFDNLVRRSRNLVVVECNDWDGICHYNAQRGWKRSKKRKQWM